LFALYLLSYSRSVFANDIQGYTDLFFRCIAHTGQGQACFGINIECHFLQNNQNHNIEILLSS